MYFVIDEKLPSLNDYIRSCRSNKFGAAKAKAIIEDEIAMYIWSAVNNGTLKTIKTPIKLQFIWHEKTKRRDYDNIAFAKKFILDAMQKQKIILNDNRKIVKGFTDDFVEDKRDFVEVIIQED